MNLRLAYKLISDAERQPRGWLNVRGREETREVLRKKADEGADYLKKQTADLRENAGARASDDPREE